jgi:hypothetical protein
MGFENFENTIEIFCLVGLKLVAAGTDGACSWGIAKERDFISRLCGEIDQGFFENTFDTVLGPIDFADLW